jgi:pimeloyl-ACP methyl ester carboxylesterase
MTLRRALTLYLAVAAALWLVASASPAAPSEAMGIALEGFPYPYPVHFMPVSLEGEDLRLAYMDVPPVGSSTGRTVVLLHGRNFPSSYWAPTINALAQAGYQVVVPDQIGFGKSSKPGFAYSFDAMARVTLALIDSLGIARFDLVGHSMGGMLAVRLARSYGARIDHLVLYSPIGLEDYRFYAPPVTDEQLALAGTRADRRRLSQAVDDQLRDQLAVDSDRAVRPVARTNQGERRISALAEVVCGFLSDDLHAAGRARDPAHRSADPVHHGRRRSQCAGARLRAAGIAREDGPERGPRAIAGGAHVECESRDFRGCRPPGASRGDAAIQ